MYGCRVVNNKCFNWRCRPTYREHTGIHGDGCHARCVPELDPPPLEPLPWDDAWLLGVLADVRRELAANREGK
jgi:hypothetical protein